MDDNTTSDNRTDGPDVHPATAAVLRHFDYSHLPPHLAEVSKPFHDLAHRLVALTGPEVTTSLGKLIEAKDWAVRAAVVASRQ
ncbi:hypothetical protein CLV30_12835 [Haloactinopolyspora alba]|uniref:Uncharacterized protein n=1 Tax=Haloactinopolyspora alba TaxID=648780 RepID=A0A2P8DEY7_9ACTN|nr:hypothetical protein [Haloactinopolyspora alba]PSK95783.1 hypothetical protein CLV30_12835 [Haloactinopolyspora alba]